MAERPLYVPVILGTTRTGSMSQHLARVMVEEVGKRPGVESELIDIRTLPLPTDGAGEDIKHPAFAEKMNRMDALVLVSPEYNHGYSGLLKHLLDTCLKEYIHKAVGVAGVSAGPFGGTRGVQDLLPVLRELGLVTIFWDVNLSNSYQQFDEQGRLKDRAWLPRIDKFLKELIWMAKVLRHGREQVAPDEESTMGATARSPMVCPTCRVPMNHHADKPIDPRDASELKRMDPATGRVVEEVHECPRCGKSGSRPADR